MWKSTITCDTCKELKHTLENNDLFTLLLESEVAILTVHVQPPCSKDHELTINYETKTKDKLTNMKKKLHIECLKCIDSNPDIAVMDTECEPWFVNAAAICFHARHEGHPFHLIYEDFEVKTPCKKKFLKHIAT